MKMGKMIKAAKKIYNQQPKGDNNLYQNPTTSI